MNRFWLVLVLLSFFVACKNDDPAPTTEVDTTITAWLDSLDIDAIRDDSGLYYYSLFDNPTGAAVFPGAVVSIYYTLRDLDGNTIATHQRVNGDSLTMKQGVSAVFPIGLDIGVGLRRQGDIYEFILPPSLGYGQLESGAINPNIITRLQVEVANVVAEADLYAQELLDIDQYIIDEQLNDTTSAGELLIPEDSVEIFTSGLAYKRLTVGDGPLPLNGDSIILNYTAEFLDGTNFDSKNGFEINWGSQVPRPLIAGFEFGVSLMQRTESALLIIPSSQGYRESALVVPFSIAADLVDESVVPDYILKVPAYRTLVFDVSRVR